MDDTMGNLFLLFLIICFFYKLYQWFSTMGYDDEPKETVMNTITYRQIYESDEQKKSKVKDTKGYTYYRITGMKHHNISSEDLGVHPAIAVAEKDNIFSKHAVAIYRYDILKKVGYVPDSDSKELFNFISNHCSSCQTPAIYALHSGEDNFHGCVFIKDFITI